MGTVAALARSLPVAILAVLLLLPDLSGLLALVAAAPASCTMVCCRKTESGCAHKTKAAAPVIPHWDAAYQCAPGCGQNPGLPGVPLAAVRASSSVFTLIEPGYYERFTASGYTIRRNAEFALYQRPPPFLLISAR